MIVIGKIICAVCGKEHSEEDKVIYDTVEEKFVHPICKTKHNAWRDDIATINKRKKG